MGSVDEKGDGRILTRLHDPSEPCLCFLSLGFGERKVVVGVVDTLDEKGYDVNQLVSTVQETVVEGG